MNISTLLMCSIFGSFVFNFPFGKVFFGDAGAYTLGDLLIWLSILLVARNPEISPYAIYCSFLAYHGHAFRDFQTYSET